MPARTDQPTDSEGAAAQEPEVAIKAAVESADALSEKEIAEIRAEALKQFQKERKAAARAAAIKAELAKLEQQHGKRALGGPLDELVSIVIDLPENANEIIIDQQRLQNGLRITRPRHVINSILETMWRGQVAEHNLQGKQREEFYRRQRPVVVTPTEFRLADVEEFVSV